MINKDLLKSIGFIKGSGWEHEVWVYEGDFWVHFGDDFSKLEGQQVNGNTVTEREFFRMFTKRIKESTAECYDHLCP